MLRFESADALLLAITSKSVPEKLISAPVAAAAAETGEFFVEPSAKITAAQKKKLKSLGVTEAKDAPLPLADKLCWAEVLPLQRHTGQLDALPSEKAPVIFDLPIEDGESTSRSLLSELVAEVLRLGNDRQAFRLLEHEGKQRALLRVIGPPYYAMLRALDRQSAITETDLSVRAYVEAAPRVWVEVGYQHPLLEEVTPQPGHWLFLPADAPWFTLPEGPFENVYEGLEIEVAADGQAWTSQTLDEKFRVPLQLRRAHQTAAAELWVLSDNAFAEVDRIVQSSDDRVLGGLSFAVGKRSDDPQDDLIVLRTRPSRKSPVEVIVSGQQYRSYLKIPNLFLPLGTSLHPPLRRDVIQKLLADDTHQITWLEPTDDGIGFTPHTLDDASFQPMQNWVDYVVDRESEAIENWMSAQHFQFESFICSDDIEKKKKPKRREPKSSDGKKAKSNDVAAEEAIEFVERSEVDIFGDEVAQVQAVEEAVWANPAVSDDRQALTQLEEQYVAAEGPHDDPARIPLWAAMGSVNAKLKHRQDTTICWSHAIWETQRPQPELVKRWLFDELAISGIKGLEKSHLKELTLRCPADDLSSGLVPACLQFAATCADTSKSAAAIAALASSDTELFHQALLKQEPQLPVRAAWLGWQALAMISNHDELALAKARDRILARLHEQGLKLEFDVPTFLRLQNSVESDRLREVQKTIAPLQQKVESWIEEHRYGSQTGRTHALAELIFAFALAKIGEGSLARKQQDTAAKELTETPVHVWVSAAYSARVKQALDGASTQSELPVELHNALEKLSKADQYAVNTLRRKSRILEPTEQVEQYKKFHGGYIDEVERTIAQLTDTRDRDQIEKTLSAMLSAKETKEDWRVHTAALELSPRLGQAFGRQVMTPALAVLDKTEDVIDRAQLLAKALTITAHFDQPQLVDSLLERLDAILPDLVASYIDSNSSGSQSANVDQMPKLAAVEQLFAHSLLGLRKFGLRDSIRNLFRKLADEINKAAEQAGKSGKDAANNSANRAVRRAKLLLAVVGGWYYDGDLESPKPVIDQVRRNLFQSDLNLMDKKALACAYLAALGQAPPEVAVGRVVEIFSETEGKPNLAGLAGQWVGSKEFSIHHLEVVEAAVAALVREDYELSPESRLWLDEDEFLVRRRIHRDVRQMVKTDV